MSSVCLLLAFPLCVCIFLVSLPFLIKTPVLLDQGPTLMTSFNLITPLKAPSLNTVTLEVKAPTYEFGGDTV